MGGKDSCIDQVKSRASIELQILKHLATIFPGLQLEPPLFYSWSVALRFRLNTGQANPPDFDAVTTRASTIYASAFGPHDVAFVVSVHKHFPYHSSRRRFGRQSREDKRFFPLARKRRIGISRPSGVATLEHTKREIEDWGASRTRIEWAEIAPLSIDYRFIFDKIAHEDFPMGAGFDGQVYFYNQTREILLHMYDDRGLDLVATTSSVLQPIYDDHKSWLLTYDLDRMENTFASVSAAATSISRAASVR